MSFIDSAVELLDRTEASLHALIADALKAKAYREIATLAAMAESLSTVTSGRGAGGAKKPADIPVSASTVLSDSPKAGSEPSWMRPKG